MSLFVRFGSGIVVIFVVHQILSSFEVVYRSIFQFEHRNLIMLSNEFNNYNIVPCSWTHPSHISEFAVLLLTFSFSIWQIRDVLLTFTVTTKLYYPTSKQIHHYLYSIGPYTCHRIVFHHCDNEQLNLFAHAFNQHRICNLISTMYVL